MEWGARAGVFEKGVCVSATVVALRRYLAEKPGASGYKLKWTTEKGELMPGVDLDDRDSLFDIMDGIKK